MFRLKGLSWFVVMLWIVADHAMYAQDAAQIVRRGKQATAYVEWTGSTARPINSDSAPPNATAFCIDAAGYFVTSDLVAKNAVSGKVRLVLNPTEANERVIEATIEREDSGAGLALLKTTAAGPFVPLDLGTTAPLVETARITAFGYPFGRAVAESRNDYPSVTVSVGRITALRRLRGALNEIQMDASLNPGNSGGPVLDETGNVIGIVQNGIQGAALNFAIPVEKLKALLARPVTSFSPTTVPFAQRAEPLDLTVNLRGPGTLTDYTVELTLAARSGSRVIPMKSEGGGKYGATVRLIENGPEPAKLRASITFSSGTVVGEVADQEFRLAGRLIKLSEISRLERDGALKATLNQGAALTEEFRGSLLTPVDLGGTRITVDLAAARRVDLTPAIVDDAPVRYTLIVRKDGATVDEKTGTIASTDVPVRTTTSAPPGLTPIESPVLESDRVSLKLPALVENVAVGGNGRFVFLDLRSIRQLAVFDASAGKVTKFLPMVSNNVMIAAGADVLFVVIPDTRQLQRWSLRTMERELTVNLDLPDQLDGVAMGSASQGPLMVMTRKGPVFFDAATMKRLELKSGTNIGRWSPHPQYPLEVRASADGSTFAAWEPGLSPSGVRFLSVDGKTTQERYEHDSRGVLLPSGDGTLLLTSSGPLSSELKPISPDSFRNVQTFPTTSAAFFMGVKREGETSSFAPARNNTRPVAPTLNIYSSGDYRLLVTLKDFDELLPAPNQNSTEVRGLTLEKRVIPIVSANLLVTLSSSRDQLILRKLDLARELEASGVDYLFTVSAPIRAVQKGQRYEYAIEVMSKRGNTQFKLESGPEGMRLSSKGVLTWDAPISEQASAVGVIVSIRDASGQEVFHSFSIALR